MVRRGTINPDTTYTAKLIEQVSEWLSRDSQKPSLLLFGGVGNGKTTMAMAIYRVLSALLKTAKDNVEPQSNVARVGPFASIPAPFFVTASQIVSACSNDNALGDALAGKGLLIIDDLGCEPVVAKTFGTEMTPIIDIITKRYAAMKPTIITTNLDPNGIIERYGIRVYDRILETFESIAFESKSYRN